MADQNWLPYMYTIPSAATKIVSQVRLAKRCPKTTRASKAVNKGPKAMRTNTLATLVKPKASMKAVNITDQHTPESQNVRDSGKNPQCRCKVSPHADRVLGVSGGIWGAWRRDQARHSGNIHIKDSTVKALR